MENTKKLLSELTLEEAQALFKNNKWLREQASEEAQESEQSYISDILAPFKDVRSLNYEFGCYKVFKVKYQEDYKDFLGVLEKINNDYGILSDEIIPLFKRLLLKIDFFDDCMLGYEGISPARYENLEKWIDDGIKKLCSFIWDYIDNMYEYSMSEEAAENELDCLLYNIGENYATDGIFIYEVNVRKYA